VGDVVFVPSSTDQTGERIEESKGFSRSRYTLPSASRQYAGKQMSLMTMILWKMTEILRKFVIWWSQWEKVFEFETYPGLRRWKKTFDSAFQKKVGFHNIKQANWKPPSGFPLILLPYWVLLNLSFPQRHRI
jgi:hypothetical protein